MPVLPNPRHERFAQELAKGRSQGDAYRSAGYDADGHAAESAGNRLLKNVEVQARVAELQAQVADHVVQELALDRAGVLEELAKIAKEPLNSETVTPAVKRAALMDYAKIEGWVVERSERGSPGDFDKMSTDELRAFVAGRPSGAGEGEESSGPSRGGRAARGKPH